MNIALSLNDIGGVIGSAVFDSNNECVVHGLPAPYEPLLLANVVSELRATVKMLAYVDESTPCSALAVELEDGYLVMRTVEGMTVVVLAQPSVNFAMLNVGLNVAGLKITKPEVGGGPRSSSAGNGAPSSSSSGAPVSVSGFSSGGSQEPRQAPPDALGTGVMNSFLKIVAKQMGPFAKVAVGDELKKLGATPQTLGRSQYDDLVAMVARRLPEPARRKEFVADAEKLVQKP